MKLSIKTSGGTPFVRKEDYEYDGKNYEADIKTGDIVKILDGGISEPGNFGDQLNFKIETRNGEKKLALNQATINVLVQEFGEETENWIGKSVRVILKKTIIAGKRAIVALLVTEGWELDEFGELFKSTDSVPSTPFDEDPLA